MSTTEQSAEDLPYDGQIFRAPQRRFDETIVFVHHFGGNKKSFARHFKFVTDLGFDAVTFNLELHDARFPIAPFRFTRDRRLGLRYLWEEQIRDILDRVPGRKILYAFSMPAGAAFLALRNRADITALICDGGPFLEVEKCTYNLFRLVYPIPTKALRAIAAVLSVGLLGARWPKEVPRLLEALPAQFPVLSFRGRHDELVPTSAIEAFFVHGPNLQLERVALDAGHLDGIRRDPTTYRDRLQTFLDRTAHALDV